MSKIPKGPVGWRTWFKNYQNALFLNDFFHVQNLPGLAWGEGHGEGDSGIEKMLLTHSYFVIFLCVTFFALFWFWPFLFSLLIMFFSEFDLDVDDNDNEVCILFVNYFKKFC